MYRCVAFRCQRFSSSRVTSGENIIIWDVETTGLNSSNDNIVELSALHPHSGEVFDTLIKPTTPMTQRVIDIHGIKNEDVSEKEIFADVWPQYKSWVEQFQDEHGSVLLLSHFAYSLDIPLLRSETQRALGGIPDGWILADTSPVIRRKLPKQEPLNMKHLSNICGLDPQTHRALSDCHNLWGVLQNLYPSNTLTELKNFYRIHKKQNKVKSRTKPPPTANWWMK